MVAEGHILPYQNVSFCYDKLVKIIGITNENPNGDGLEPLISYHAGALPTELWPL